MTLKQKTVSGITWSFIDTFAGQGITFVVGIILARLLSPAEFGLIGMLTIFIAISSAFIDSGFRNALIRKPDASESDYSTVFYFNLAVGAFFFLILFFSAGAIAAFFKEPQLKIMVRVLGLSLIIDSLTLIQRTILIKRINFKLQAKISLLAAALSGIIAIAMAYQGFGVWALVAQRLSNQAINSLLLWLWNSWKPTVFFSVESFKELFAFGNRLLISGIISAIYNNLYSFIIGKFFSAEGLGYYTRAKGFRDLTAANFNSIISRVTYPVLATLQNDKTKLKEGYRQLIKVTQFATFAMMFGMGVVAEPLVHTLIGAKWETSIAYLQLLCISGMLYPTQALNLNMLQVLGRSDLYLRVSLLKKLISIPFIILGIFYGIKALLMANILYSWISYYLNSYWSGKFINYRVSKQLKDITPSFLFTASMAIVVYLVGLILPYSYPIKLLIQIIVGIGYTIGLAELIKYKEYLYIKEIAIEQIKKVVDVKKNK